MAFSIFGLFKRKSSFERDLEEFNKFMNSYGWTLHKRSESPKIRMEWRCTVEVGDVQLTYSIIRSSITVRDTGECILYELRKANDFTWAPAIVTFCEDWLDEESLDRIDSRIDDECRRLEQIEYGLKLHNEFWKGSSFDNLEKYS